MISSFYTKKRSKKREIASDPQKQRVYNMEREWIGHAVHTTMHPDKLREIVRHACRKARVPVPKLHIENKPKTRVFGHCNDTTITLNAGFHGQNLSVLLHELAHWINDQKNPDSTAHGPNFCTIYRTLLADYRMLPTIAFDELAISYGVEHNGI